MPGPETLSGVETLPDDPREELQDAEAPPEDDAISVPLYAAGLVVTVCGLAAVNAAFERPDPRLVTTMLLLTVIGFAFSFGCRWLKIRPRFIEVLGLAFLAYVAYGLATQQIDASLFTPGDRGELRMAMYLAWFTVLRSWTLVSDWHVLFACVPALAMIGVVASVNPYDPANLVCFAVFLASSAFLLIHQNYLQNRARASEREQARAPGALLWAQAGLAGGAAAAVLLLGSVLVVPVQSLFSGVSLAQQVHRLVGAGKTNDTPIPLVTTRFSDQSTLDVGTGSGWSASTEVALHVVPADGQEHYWRGRTYDRYNGLGWQSTLEGHVQPLQRTGPAFAVPRALTPGDAEAAQAPAGPLFQTVYAVRGDTDEYYYAAGLRALTPAPGPPGEPGEDVSWCRDGSLDRHDGGPVRGTYITQSAEPLDPYAAETQQRLRGAGTDYPPEVRRLYLGPISGDVITPEDTDYYRQAVLDAISALPAERRSPFDQALAIRDWVAGHCLYSLDVAPISGNVDHVHEFLAHTQRGYCDLFASAMAVLCRADGIPARMVTGFAPGLRAGDGFDLRAMDKHAWVEVYFPRYGWATLDPTVGTRADNSVPGSHKGPAVLSRLWQALTAQGPVPAVLSGVIVLILLYLFKVEVWDRWRERRAADPARGRSAAAHTEVGRQYAEVTRALGRLGLPRRPSETPDEYAARGAAFLAAETPTVPAATLLAVTRRFDGARYGNARATDSADLRPAVAEFVTAAGRTRRQRFLRRLWRGGERV